MENKNEQSSVTSYGYLTVSVTTANGTLPVENADVRISGGDDENKNIEIILTTDRSGNTEKTALPTPRAELSQTPSNRYVFSTYKIEVTADGYYAGLLTDVPVFAGIHSLQRVILIPYSAYNPADNAPTIGLNTRESEDLSE